MNWNNDLQQTLSTQLNDSRKSVPKTPEQKPLIMSKEDRCGAANSRTWIEIVRMTDQTIPFESLALGPPDTFAKMYADRRKAFAGYDLRRRDAYRLQIQLSSEYSGSSIVVNALSVAEVVPFGVFLILALFTILGFQQASYRTQLRTLLENDSGHGRALSAAKAQFFAGPPLRDGLGLKKHFVVSPEAIITSSLCFSVIVLLLSVVSTFILNLVHLTDSILFSYPFALYASLVVLTWSLIVTRKAYLGGDRRGHESTRLLMKRLQKFSNVLTLSFVTLGLLSLALPWAVSDSFEAAFKGYQFVLKQRSTGRLINYTTYALDPKIFRDVRLQVSLALVFLLVCALCALLGSHLGKRLAAVLVHAQSLLAFVVFFLGVYYLIYMSTLEYESLFTGPWLDRLSAYPFFSGSEGASMMLFDPAYGFWIFLCSCLTLALLALLQSPETLRPD